MLAFPLNFNGFSMTIIIIIIIIVSPTPYYTGSVRMFPMLRAQTLQIIWKSRTRPRPRGGEWARKKWKIWPHIIEHENLYIIKRSFPLFCHACKMKMKRLRLYTHGFLYYTVHGTQPGLASQSQLIDSLAWLCVSVSVSLLLLLRFLILLLWHVCELKTDVFCE